MAVASGVNIIRKIEVIEAHGHHGGAWKVAYADFMTAMMAFFLLLWILSSSDEEKLRGIAEYFTYATMPGGSGVLDGATLGPPGTLSASNGAVVARGSDLGKVDDQSPSLWEIQDSSPTGDPAEVVVGSNEGEQQNPAGGESVQFDNPIETQDSHNASSGGGVSDDNDKEVGKAKDDARFSALELELVQAMQRSVDLKPLVENVIFERTPEGLRIQIVDQEGRPMFPRGGGEMLAEAVVLMEQLGKSIAELPNEISVSGHTDSTPFSNGGSYDNWDLSTDRANNLRRTLIDSGVETKRISRVSGMADIEPLLPEDPNHASNRRITVLLQYGSDVSQAASIQETRNAPQTKSTSPNSPKDITNIQSASHTVLIKPEVFSKLRSALQ